jgi:hypothetical protein
VNRPRAVFHRMLLRGLLGVAMLGCAPCGHAQAKGTERTFPQSKAIIEKALKEIQTGGRLPVLDGFATSAEHPLERYQRGYYQSKFQVSAAPAPSGGSVVRVTVEVTAWYADPVPSKSGYQLLTSNGRLEADVMDQLAEQLAGNAGVGASVAAAQEQPAKTPASTEPTISAPMPRLPEIGRNYSSSLSQSMAAQEQAAQSGSKKVEDKDGGPLQAEAASLEEILKNQAHPKNLVAVKKSGTPVVASASLNAKTLFMASEHDEFEMLDFTRDWVHVRISGLSRGWIWRNNVELPETVPDSDAPPPRTPVAVAAEVFHVTREEVAPFPGDWAPLRGKSVKIVSVEKIDENGKDSGPLLRLEFAKSVLDKDYAELAEKAQQLGGIVLIFDSVDGGMIAATFPTLQQWKAGTLSDAALWHQCFFDPPETFAEAGAGASP